jgi:hypothetical protein
MIISSRRAEAAALAVTIRPVRLARECRDVALDLPASHVNRADSIPNDGGTA